MLERRTQRAIDIIFFLGAMSCLAGRDAAAQCIIDVSTGFDQASGLVLLEGDIDDDYTVDDGLGLGPQPVFTGGAANGFPIPPWIANDDLSLWVSPGVAGSVFPGTYTYEIVFEVEEDDATASLLVLSGRWASDDSGLDILINGTSTGIPGGGFGSWTELPAEAGFGLFRSGDNSIQFVVENALGAGADVENPAGLRVEACVLLSKPVERLVDISTGFDQVGQEPIPERSADDDYIVLGPPGEFPAVVTTDDAFPIPPWLANSVQSRWVGTSDLDSSGPSGQYTYTIRVELPPEIDPDDAVLMGGLAADDRVSDVHVNGISTGIVAEGFAELTPFPLDAGRGLFKAGLNTIQFLVQNSADSATGLRVDGEVTEGPPRLEPAPSLLRLDSGFDEEAGTTLASGEIDETWVVYGPPGSDVGPMYASVVPDDVFPIPPWLATTAGSRWVGLPEEGTSGPAGTYVFRTTVDVPAGLNPLELQLVGGWTSDNVGLEVLVNGIPTGLFQGGDFTVLHLFPEGAALGLFETGLNDVEFRVDNASAGPVGLRVEAVVGTGRVDPADLSSGIGGRGEGPLPGGLQDPRYTITGPTGSGIGPRPATLLGQEALEPSWLADSETSRWVGVDDADPSGPEGLWTYDLEFELPVEMNAYRAVLTGGWAAAGSGVDVLLNGQSLGLTAEGPTGLTGFPAGAGRGQFVPGTNTLRFVVETTEAGPTGLRVDARLDVVVETNPLDISTGFDSEAGALLDIGMVDAGWEVLTPAVLTEDAFVVDDEDLGIAAWLDRGVTSRWVGPPGAIAVDPGEYRYSTTVTLESEEAAAAARLVGFFAADDGGTDVLINEQSTGIVTAAGFTGATYFPEDAGAGLFVMGPNTIEFVVSNGGEGANPSGLRVDAWVSLGDIEPPTTAFRRGDADAGGTLNITDGIFVLNFLFLGGEEPPCFDAADADDSGALNITDGVYILNFLFLGGPNPPAPGEETCGADPTDEDDLDCASFPACEG